jgi:hypothetical protein
VPAHQAWNGFFWNDDALGDSISSLRFVSLDGSREIRKDLLVLRGIKRRRRLRIR